MLHRELKPRNKWMNLAELLLKKNITGDSWSLILDSSRFDRIIIIL